MPYTPIESGVGGVWLAKQPAAGTIAPPAQAGTVKLRKTGDDALKAGKVHGQEEYVDGESFANPVIFVDAIGGPIGSQTFQAQIETAGLTLAVCTGVDTVTGIAPDFTHTITTSTVQGPMVTMRQKTGVTVGPWRDAFWDARIGKWTWNCGQDQKTAHAMIDLLALKAGDVFAVDPTAADSGTDPFRWEEVEGSITIDGFVYNEIEGETIELDRKLDVHRGDSVAPKAYVPGKGTVMRSFTTLVTDNVLTLMRTALWGSATPADGTSPTKTVKYISLSTKYTRSATRSLQIDTPKVEMKTDDFEVSPRTSGGKIPVTLGGQCVKNGATPHLTAVAKTGDATSYVA